MIKAIGSKSYVEQNVKTQEFYIIIKDILVHEKVNQMREFEHHMSVTCFQHSLNVAYCNYRICKAFNLDYISAARAGLLHDFYLYNWKTDKTDDSKLHIFSHPKLALKNAKKYFEISEIEENIILSHMWPASPVFPKCSESVVIILADKYCAMVEIANCILSYIKSSFLSVIKLIFRSHKFNKNDDTIQ